MERVEGYGGLRWGRQNHSGKGKLGLHEVHSTDYRKDKKWIVLESADWGRDSDI